VEGQGIDMSLAGDRKIKAVPHVMYVDREETRKRLKVKLGKGISEKTATNTHKKNHVQSLG
jgi:hypothetical protein